MGTLYVFQAGQTTWEAEQRIPSMAGAPLTDAGVREVESAARELAERGIEDIFACGAESQRQTGELLASALGVKLRCDEELRGLDYGLWQGLTEDEVRRRQPSLWREWEETPAEVCPPGGETLAEAAQRLRGALHALLRKHRKGATAVVLCPMMRRLAGCLIRGVDAGHCPDAERSDSPWDVYETGGETL